MKKVLIISTSLRKGSNSDYLAHEFERGVKDSGNEAEFVTLSDKRISFCIGCLSCQKTMKCVIKDDVQGITEKVKNADAIVFATPVYYYGMSGQMKTLLDRMNSLYPSDYRFRDVYVIATAAENENSAIDGTVTGVQGWIDCFELAHLSGVIRGIGINDANAAKEHKDICNAAYEMGKSVLLSRA